MTWLGEAKTPDGMRLYAIGDVHGRDDLLAAAHERIADDLAERPAHDHRIIHLGDYVDRGRDSAAVVGRLCRLAEADGHVVCLSGNHEALMLDFLVEPVAAGPDWMMNGGDETLLSYGLAVPSRPTAETVHRARATNSRRASAHPSGASSRASPLTARFGDYFFCHAGIRPGVPLAEQSADDLIWIRDEFLFDPRDHGVVVIHGHTPVRAPDIRRNRIDIDTGAVFSGVLTTLVLEGTSYGFL